MTGTALHGLVFALQEAQEPTRHVGGEAALVLPDFTQSSFLGMTGQSLLTLGLLVCLVGLAFGLWIYKQLQALPVHRSMLEISELIYETCKTYLGTQSKFIALLWGFIGLV